MQTDSDRGLLSIVVSAALCLAAILAWQGGSSDTGSLAETLEAEGAALRRQNRLEEAARRYEEALALHRKAAPGSLAVAATLNHLGNLAEDRGDLEVSETYHREALELRRKLAPKSLAVAASLNNLGLLAARRGDQDAGEAFHRQALALEEKLAPDGPEVATSLNNLGNVAWYRGDMAAAYDFYQRALTIWEKLDPQSADTALGLNNLGLVSLNRGDLTGAEAFLRRALVIKQRRLPGSRQVAFTHNLLAAVAGNRGDLEACAEHLRRALAIREKLAPNGLETAESLAGLALVALLREDATTAESMYRRALAIQQEHAPASQDTALSLQGLGLASRHRGDSEAARQYLDRALSIFEELAVENVYLADLHRDLGISEIDRGNLAAAEHHLRQALALLGRVAPASRREALALHDLGNVHRRRGQTEAALELYGRALDALEAQVRRLGGSWEIQADFRARYLHLYGDLVDLLVALDRGTEAFYVLERSRARILLERLAKRDLRLAALACPEPLDLAGAQRALEAGTLLLSYHVSKERSLLFAVEPQTGDRAAPEVFSLPIGEDELRREVTSFRRLIRTTRLDPSFDGELEARSRRLYRLLVEPAEPRIARARRLVVLADGPLYSLPFSALVSHAEPGPSLYLGEWKPLCFNLSATLHAELRGHASAASRREPALLAIGDPIPRDPLAEPLPPMTNAAFLGRLRQRRDLPPLPQSRDEVERIAALFPAGQARTLLGPEATEENARRLGSGASFVHFASHARLDTSSPFDSALVLSLPGEDGDDGLLHAWEILEGPRSDAELVVLSVCSGALGKEVAGEGTIGLVQAFLYAGTRSTLASLWEVADGSSADFMEAFYGAVLEGERKDEALRRARLRLLHGAGGVSGREAHPFYWAGFQLTGDCR